MIEKTKSGMSKGNISDSKRARKREEVKVLLQELLDLEEKRRIVHAAARFDVEMKLVIAKNNLAFLNLPWLIFILQLIARIYSKDQNC